MSTSQHQRRIRYSQNFLHNRKLVSRLVRESSLDAGDLVLEIGPGDGAITSELVRTCRHVLAIEADQRQVQRLRQRFGDATNLTLFSTDFLDFPLPETPHKVFASIPFNITTAIIGKLTTGTAPPTEMYLVVQQEVAERFLGHPKGTMMSAEHYPWFEASIVHQFRRADFRPQPSVDSVLLHIRQRSSPGIDWDDRGRYLDLVVAVFTAWKPTVRDALETLIPRSVMVTVNRHR
jgi:23S rRNA (adenine-N6)-dimethyltransferase